MDIWIRSITTWAHKARLPAVAWELPVFSSGSDAGSVTVPGELDDVTGDWLIIDGRLYVVKSCSPKNGATQISVLLPEQAFSRQLRYNGDGTEAFGTFLAAALASEYVAQADAMYAMPYLTVSNLDATAFTFPVASGETYTLLQIMQLAAAAGVYLTWTPSVSGLSVNIAARPAAEHRLFFSANREQLSSQTYTSSVVAKATVRQVETDKDTGEITVLDSGVYYWHGDGTISTTPPSPRIPGTWVLVDVKPEVSLAEGAAAAFGKNTQAYKIEFYSSRPLQLNDVVLCRIGELVSRGIITFARRSSKDDRTFYRAGSAATTLTDKVSALSGRSSVSSGSSGGGGGATTVTVDVGDVTTLPAGSPATVENVGTQTNVVLDFGIPQGAQGAAGQNGQDGAAAGFGTPTATVDSNVGTPGVTVSASGPDTAKVFAFSFTNLKGAQGAAGQDGQDGAAAGFGTPTATVDSNVGTPGVTVSASGPDTAKVFAFSFTNLKGAQGAAGQDGQDGQDGAAATVAVGTVTTLPAGSPATVTNSGTAEAAVLNFGIPAGPQGPAGSAPIVGSITLSTSWTAGTNEYTQTVTVSGATVSSNSKVDLQPDKAAILQMLADGVSALYIENNAGTLTCHAVNGQLTSSVTLQCTVTEVS